MSKPIRIYMVGAHSTGKTTLARWVRDTYGLPMISEVARGVLAEMEARLETLRTSIDLVNRYQEEVFERQMAAELEQQGAFVSDRAFCNLAYAAHHAQILWRLSHDERLQQYMRSVRDGLVFFVRPHRELVVHDGVRAGVEWEDVVRIDGMVKLQLEWSGIPYIPVASLSMQERVRLLERVLALAGLEPVRGETERTGQLLLDYDEGRPPATRSRHVSRGSGTRGEPTPRAEADAPGTNGRGRG